MMKGSRREKQFKVTDSVSLITVKIGGDDEAGGFVEITVQSGTASLAEVFETFERLLRLMNGNVKEKLRDLAYT